MAITRDVFIEDKELLKALLEKEELVEQGRKLEADKTEIIKQQGELSNEIEKQKQVVLPLMAKHKIEVGEYEQVSNVQVKDGKVYAEVIDLVENAKEYFRSMKEKEAELKNFDKEDGKDE